MEYFAGLDVSIEETAICVVGDDGKVVLETEVPTEPQLIADALERYFGRHPEYALGDQGRLRFLTTGSPGGQSERIERFWGEPLTFEKA